jgi:hypothetical protein
MKHLHKQTAFTLIEFLLAFSIFAVISLTIYAVFFNGIQISRKSQSLGDSLSEMQWSFSTIASDLENMVSYTMSDAEEKHPSFLGNSTGFTFWIATSDGLRRVKYSIASLEEVQIHTVEVGNRRAKKVSIKNSSSTQLSTVYLLRSETPLTNDPGFSEEEEILTRKIIAGSWKISYAAKEKDSIVWKDQLEDDVPPLGLRISTQFVNSSDLDHPFAVQQNLMVPIGLWNNQEPLKNDAKKTTI